MYEREVEVFRALGDPIRLTILGMLRVREACVCELVERLPVSQPAVSQHLRKLKDARLVCERRYKSWIYYRIREDLPRTVASVIEGLACSAEDEEWLKQNQVGTSCETLLDR